MIYLVNFMIFIRTTPMMSSGLSQPGLLTVKLNAAILDINF